MWTKQAWCLAVQMLTLKKFGLYQTPVQLVA